ncbi:M1 family aminopeptidase [Candidatus Neomarinimicrobiota bacterium]
MSSRRNCPSRIIPILIMILSLVSLSSGQDRGFSNSRSTVHYTRPRTVDIKHVKLELVVNYAEQSIIGSATTLFSPINDGLDRIALDAVNLDIETVQLLRRVDIEKGNLTGTQALDFKLENGQIIVELDRKYNADDELAVVIQYQAQPKMGLYFVYPDSVYTQKPLQLWSQGEMVESRHWFPCYDAPNDRMTSEMIITVPKGQLAISNGELVDSWVDEAAGAATYHWRENVPHVSYLVSVVAGEFHETQERWRDIPVLYYVDPSDSSKVERAFSKTVDMMEYYSEVIGIDYPYEKYAQTTITEFMWGGMENISATTLTDGTLRDARAQLDYSSDGLVAHELAHQWWGDLITTKNWNHIWLNEGFATYFDALYVEHDTGREEYIMKMAGNREKYFSEDWEKYRRPIVTNVYENAEQMFDRHAYQKGAWVLQMLRYVLGDELWWKAIRHYGAEYREETVETNDFRQAIEDATGQPLEWFFDEWIFSAGHPEYEVSWKWSSKESAVALKVRQVQFVDHVTPLFSMPIKIAVSSAAGTDTTTITVDELEELFLIPSQGKPTLVEFDPEEWVLKELHFKKPKKEWLQQLATAGPASRLRAAIALGKITDKNVAQALGKALREDTFRGVRAAAATALGKHNSRAARQELLTALNDEHARVRNEVVKALGNFRGDDVVADSLEAVFRRDPSYYAQAACIAALAELKVDRAYDLAIEALGMDSYEEIIRIDALKALLQTGRAGVDAIIIDWTTYGKPVQMRGKAIGLLPKVALKYPNRKAEIRELLISYLEDPYFGAIDASIKALGILGDKQAVPALQKFQNTALDFGRKNAATEAIESLGE